MASRGLIHAVFALAWASTLCQDTCGFSHPVSARNSLAFAYGKVEIHSRPVNRLKCTPRRIERCRIPPGPAMCAGVGFGAPKKRLKFGYGGSEIDQQEQLALW
jgi:hypothetical protein